MGDMTDRILEFIIAHKLANDGNSPSIRTIGRGVELAPSTVKYHLAKLETEGQIIVTDGEISISGGLWLRLDESLQTAIEGS